MQNNFFQYLDLGLDIDFSFLADHEKLIIDHNEVYASSTNRYDINLTKLLENIGLKINHIDILCLPGQREAGAENGVPVHYDGHWHGRRDSKIVWVLGEPENLMVWYELKDPEEKPTIIHQSINGGKPQPFQMYYPDDCNVIYSGRLINPTLINVDILHSVSNKSNKPQWYISYSLGDLQTGEFVPWETTYPLLKPYFKTI